MPAPPEFLWVGREIRQAEIDHQVKAHALTQSPRDIGVTGEVAKNLKGKRVNGQEHITRLIWSRTCENGVNDFCQVVCHKNFLK